MEINLPYRIYYYIYIDKCMFYVVDVRCPLSKKNFDVNNEIITAMVLV